MIYHLHRLQNGEISFVVLGERRMILRDQAFSATVQITADQLQEVGARRFLREVPRMATVGLEQNLAEAVNQLRHPTAVLVDVDPFEIGDGELPAYPMPRRWVGWAHLVFCVRTPVWATFFAQREPELSIGFHFGMTLGLAICPTEPLGFPGESYPQFPFFSRELEVPDDWNPDNMLLRQEGHRRLSRMLGECFAIGTPQ